MKETFMRMKENVGVSRETMKEIGNAIRFYFRFKKISHEEAARRLGYSSYSVVANQLCVGRFGRNVARKWAGEFGFNEEFLMTGKGKLIRRIYSYAGNQGIKS